MRFGFVAAVAAVCVFAVSASAAPTVNGRLTLDVIGAAPVAGKTFRVDANVYSDPGAGEGPLTFTLVLTLPEGMEVLEWSSPFQTPSCSRPGARTVRCNGEVIAVDITNAITFRLRTPRAGVYPIRGEIAVPEDPKLADNQYTLELRVAAAPPTRAGVTRTGTARDDVLVGTPRNDRLSGRGGNDVLRGLAGADTLNGGPGSDRIDAGAGNVIIWAKDGTRDRVACGTGRDVVTADRIDVLSGCETVHR